MSQLNRPLPELSPARLRGFLPAILQGLRLFREEERRLRRRCEAQEWSVARRNRRDLEELRRQIRVWAED